MTLAIARACEASADLREAMKEARLSRAGSRNWRMVVQAACRAAQTHIACEEPVPLVRYRRHTAAAARRAIGRQWISFTTARLLGGHLR